MTTNMTPAELAELREDLDEAVLPDLIIVRRRVTAGVGWEEVGRWRGRWRLGGATDVAVASEPAAALNAQATVRLESAADVRIGDNLFVGSYPDGQRLEVALVSPGPRAHWTVLARIEEGR